MAQSRPRYILGRLFYFPGASMDVGTALWLGLLAIAFVIAAVAIRCAYHWDEDDWDDAGDGR